MRPAPKLDAATPADAPRPSLTESYAFCEQIALGHGESFPVASLLTPGRLRKHVRALYAFARMADDYADEPEYQGRRAELLDHFENELERCFHDPGSASHPIFIALADTAERFELPIAPFQQLLSAFRSDLSQRRHATFSELRSYLVQAAEPVGRLMLYMFGYRSPALLRYADDLSAGLALANFWQDVGRDLDRDRIYLPAEDLRHFGVTEADLAARRPTQAFRDLMRFEVARARATLDRGRPLIEAVGPDVGVDLAAFWLGGRAMLDKIESAGFDVLTRRPHANVFDLFRVGVRAVLWRTRVRMAGRGAVTAAEG